jgi:hypothetical protein
MYHGIKEIATHDFVRPQSSHNHLEPVWVRRGKAQNSSGRVNKPTRQLTLQPVAAEASMEAMKCSKPLVQKARKRVSEPAGRNANEHRASPETI